LQILVETYGATEKENQGKKKPASTGKSGTVPARATTPFNNSAVASNHHNYAPSSSTYGKGVVTPAVRPAPPSSSQSVPNKRQRLGDSTSNHLTVSRATLGVSRGPGANGRTSPKSVSRIKTPSYTSLPRPMPIPKPGTQQHALGHGRVPSSQSRLASSTSTRVPSGAAGRPSRNTGRTRRESFKPRPSMDDDWAADARRWVANAVVKEEDEDYS
jgi:protein regulator of cytokinesis 1